MVGSGLAESMALLMTLTLYAGSAQLTRAAPDRVGRAPGSSSRQGFVVNLRFPIFGRRCISFFAICPRAAWRRATSLPTWASSCSSRATATLRVRGTREQLWFFIGVITPGLGLSREHSDCRHIPGRPGPAAWSLDFAAVLALLAIVVPLATTRPMLAAMAAAAVTAWVGQFFLGARAGGGRYRGRGGPACWRNATRGVAHEPGRGNRGCVRLCRHPRG